MSIILPNLKHSFICLVPVPVPIQFRFRFRIPDFDSRSGCSFPGLLKKVHAQGSLDVALQDGASISILSFLFPMEPRRFAICLALGISFFLASVAVYLLTSETYWRRKVTYILIF